MNLSPTTDLNRRGNSAGLAEFEVPRWMSWVLFAAGIYNLAWGIWVVLRPEDLFQMTGMQPPRYPGIWQCVGMIVGVYGIGYLAAAKHPIRHWPIVLVGFLGKTLGPLGMLHQLIMLPADDPARLPASWLWMNLTNDLIWWLPFAAILYLAFKIRSAPQASGQIETVFDANHRFRTQHGLTLSELSNRETLMIVFLRHSGCTFCREALQDLRGQRARIESSGKTLVLVHMGDNDSTQQFFEAYGMGNVHRVSDPECALYRAYRLPRGGWRQLFGAAVWWPGFQAAIVDRHGVGKLVGDGFQMPGVFVVRRDKIIDQFIHETAASRPDYCSIAEKLESELESEAEPSIDS